MAMDRANSPPCPRPTHRPTFRPHRKCRKDCCSGEEAWALSSISRVKDPSKGSIDRLIALTRDDMGKVNELILSKAGSHVELIPHDRQTI